MLIKIEQEGEIIELREHILLKNEKGYSEHTVSVGKGIYKDFLFKEIYIGYAHLVFEEKTKISFTNKTESIKMHFVLSGNTLMHSETQTHPFKSYHHNLIYSPKTETNWEWETDNELQLFEVNMKIDFFKKYISKKDPYISLFIDAIEKQIPYCLIKENLTATAEIISIIKEIIHCEREQIYKKMFIESKIIQLLLLQLEQLYHNNCPLKYPLKKSDSTKMYQVRDIILDNLKHPFSLKELAHLVGTNEFTLKKGFKTIFGTTVFGFLNNIKMEKAQNLLTEQELTITQIAELVGYKNAAHFTTAFKKKYGTLPSTLKKQRNNVFHLN
ncbi:helix-turn-helix transcriptional regulator [Flavobacterium psychrophilum]|nr:helix-turn-helix transcriptional regulator [Flavobacterium psychrophilum]EKT3965993.1 helix-turn-helix transcriptional regulator [Flavobacterium psychrophilum]EKT4510367.1 helix-turn-helix transcriptional regulator [Flavobacterium psychrophilum]